MTLSVGELNLRESGGSGVGGGGGRVKREHLLLESGILRFSNMIQIYLKWILRVNNVINYSMGL